MRWDSPTTSDCRSRTAVWRSVSVASTGWDWPAICGLRDKSSPPAAAVLAWAAPQYRQKLTPEGISSPQLEQFIERDLAPENALDFE